jgi:hypothetical protein
MDFAGRLWGNLSSAIVDDPPPAASDGQEELMRTYSGGCQCGKVRYAVALELGEVISCNCSRCGKLGSLLTFAPASSFKLVSGEDDMTEYQFNVKKFDGKSL